jgi:cell division protein ZapA
MQPPRAPIQLTVGGQAYRVVASVPEEELRRLAAVVDERIRAIVPPGKPVSPNAILLAAIALVNDLEEEQRRREGVEAKSRDVLRRLLARIDEALEGGPDDDEGASTPPPPATL